MFFVILFSELSLTVIKFVNHDLTVKEAEHLSKERDKPMQSRKPLFHLNICACRFRLIKVRLG